MPLTEFELIERYFGSCGHRRADVPLGIGDDAALLESPAGCQLVAATDTLVAGVHFPPGPPPASLGHRALAVNLSDLAAMGAHPAWALLALTLPSVDADFLREFALGLGDLGRAHGVALVGGDTTSGPLCVTVQLLGHVPAGEALRRAGGQPGDVLFVSGTPGDAAAGLAVVQGLLRGPAAALAFLRGRFEFPTPRVALGQALRPYASACIDVSDGLLGDAGKLAAASGCGLSIESRGLPLSEPLIEACGEARAAELALTGGEDYELCFCVPPGRLAALERAVPAARWGYRRIGSLTAEPGSVVTRDGEPTGLQHAGWMHFHA